MIYGTGCDICDIARMAEKLGGAHGEHFCRRVFGEEERRSLSLPAEILTKHQQESAAADFAAKEAFLKAMGTGLSGFALGEIEALREESGKPYYRFSGETLETVQKLGITAHLSLSHEAGLAMAFCVLEQLQSETENTL